MGDTFFYHHVDKTLIRGTVQTILTLPQDLHVPVSGDGTYARISVRVWDQDVSSLPASLTLDRSPWTVRIDRIEDGALTDSATSGSVVTPDSTNTTISVDLPSGCKPGDTILLTLTKDPFQTQIGGEAYPQLEKGEVRHIDLEYYRAERLSCLAGDEGMYL